MKANADTCHVPKYQKENFTGNNGGNKIYVTKFEKLLVVTFNTAQEMNFSIKDFFSKTKSTGDCVFGHIY